jgi:hypothetical protein
MSSPHAIVIAALLLATTGPAFADAIDGHWCDTGTRHMEISGPSITTPTGASLSGEYNRHGFKYQEPSDGKPIVMVLLNEVTLRLKAGDRPEEIWHRCAAPTSQRDNNPSGTGHG